MIGVGPAGSDLSSYTGAVERVRRDSIINCPTRTTRGCVAQREEAKSKKSIVSLGTCRASHAPNLGRGILERTRARGLIWNRQNLSYYVHD
jgi:hypothetical protein